MSVEEHYDLKREYNRNERALSKTFHLNSYNNWVKAFVFNMYAKSGDKILDLCCGKGGDLLKWKNLNVAKIVGFDLSGVSIEQANDRARKLKIKNAEFYKSDLSCEKIHLSEKFDIVSVQFALHYFFKNEFCITNIFETIKSNIKTGGYIICSFPDYEIVSKHKSFKNSICSYNFLNENEYFFTLNDAINCSEYVIKRCSLNALLKQHELELVFEKNFKDFYEERNKSNLFDKMKVSINDAKDMDDYWEVINFYKMCVFKSL